MALRRHSKSGTPSIEVCHLNVALIVQIEGSTLAVLEYGLPGGTAVSCCVLEQGDSVSLFVGCHTIIPSGIVGCGIETCCWENRVRIRLIPLWLCGVAIIWDPDLVQDLLMTGGVSVKFPSLLGIKNSP